MLRQIWHRAAALALPLTLAICLPPMAVIAINLHAQSASSSSQANNSKSSGADSAAAAAKEAARKKAFEADLKSLEDGGSFHPSGSSSGVSQSLFVSPKVVNMVRGQRADLGAFDSHGKDVSSQVEWFTSNSRVATLISGHGRAQIIAKAPGEVSVRVRMGSNEASADVTVYNGRSLPPGTPAWIPATIPGFKAQLNQPAAGATRARPSPSQR